MRAKPRWISTNDSGEHCLIVDISHVEDDSIRDPVDTATTRELQATAPGVDLPVDVGVRCNMGGSELIHYYKVVNFEQDAFFIMHIFYIFSIFNMNLRMNLMYSFGSF